MWYTKADDTIDQAKFRSRSDDPVIAFATTLPTRSRRTGNRVILKNCGATIDRRATSLRAEFATPHSPGNLAGRFE